MSEDDKQHEAWHTNVPWSRQDELREESARNSSENELHANDDTVWINFAAVWRSFKAWRAARRKTKTDSNE